MDNAAPAFNSVTLRIRRNETPITGVLWDGTAHTATPFRGWLELSELLEAATAINEIAEP